MWPGRSVSGTGINLPTSKICGPEGILFPGEFESTEVDEVNSDEPAGRGGGQGGVLVIETKPGLLPWSGLVPLLVP